MESLLQCKLTLMHLVTFSPKKYPRENTEIHKTNKVLSAYNIALERAGVSIRYPKTKKKYNAQFLVVDDVYTPIIGARQISQQTGFLVVQHQSIQLASNTEASTNPQTTSLTKDQTSFMRCIEREINDGGRYQSPVTDERKNITKIILLPISSKCGEQEVDR